MTLLWYFKPDIHIHICQKQKCQKCSCSKTRAHFSPTAASQMSLYKWHQHIQNTSNSIVSSSPIAIFVMLSMIFAGLNFFRCLPIKLGLLKIKRAIFPHKNYCVYDTCKSTCDSSKRTCIQCMLHVHLNLSYGPGPVPNKVIPPTPTSFPLVSNSSHYVVHGHHKNRKWAKLMWQWLLLQDTNIHVHVHRNNK